MLRGGNLVPGIRLFMLLPGTNKNGEEERRRATTDVPSGWKRNGSGHESRDPDSRGGTVESEN
jgi:hypothetical protein